MWCAIIVTISNPILHQVAKIVNIILVQLHIYNTKRVTQRIHAYLHVFSLIYLR